MNPRFKPLISSTSESNSDSRPFQLKIVPAEETTAPFKPLSKMLSSAKGGSPMSGAESESDGDVEPKLETKREGDKITRITVTCNCGRTHEIECEY